MKQFVEALENDQPEIRQAACLVLMLLDSKEDFLSDATLSQLAFVCCSDSEAEVRAQAKQTLMAAGPRGRSYHDCMTLSMNGFQGLTVK